MEVDKIISCNLIFKDGSKMEIKPANGLVLEWEKLEKRRIRMDKIVKGYKVFNSNWTCRDKQYTCPGHLKKM